ncbi:GNAT family N-acetyltransferase [Saccharibacillus sp. CPCC 101409]|uniref:GNAT family N-acetyltransferase n=1 Tax=Saccharibacillus sp. CPCC 101409 TaxID=3058041 RepID=UPI0026714800|nr:GNAT family N-acetyltransferase [Saccharibacillus sp. CPCC 101409]MDO3411946.1 GNAT family N-acetyltransferase [Saccharibacillus sp. CPCC 101409]
MEHLKLFHEETVVKNGKNLIVQGPVPPETLKNMTLHDQLDAFRRPKEQHEALVEIAELPEGRIIAATDGDTVVGYVTFHYADEYERWSEGKMDDLVELGAIEVANDYRGAGLSKKLLDVAFLGGQLDNAIVFTTEYYWHWDLESTGLSVWDYRKMMEDLMKNVDMVWFATDDPEICSHPANCLMVRVGKKVPQESVEAFDRLRFRQRFMY